MDTSGAILKTAGKTVFYSHNGTGRDSYIASGSGGLSAAPQSNIQPPVGSMNIKKPYRSTMPTIHSRTLQYHSNGSGRDAYIGVSNGGLMSDSKAGDFKGTFYNSLRSYDQSQTSADWNKTTSFGRRGSQSPRGREGLTGYVQPLPKYVQTQRKFQKSLDHRLALPKYMKGEINEATKRQSPFKNPIKNIE